MGNCCSGEAISDEDKNYYLEPKKSDDNLQKVKEDEVLTNNNGIPDKEDQVVPNNDTSDKEDKEQIPSNVQSNQTAGEETVITPAGNRMSQHDYNQFQNNIWPPVDSDANQQSTHSNTAQNNNKAVNKNEDVPYNVADNIWPPIKTTDQEDDFQKNVWPPQESLDNISTHQSKSRDISHQSSNNVYPAPNVKEEERFSAPHTKDEEVVYSTRQVRNNSCAFDQQDYVQLNAGFEKPHA